MVKRSNINLNINLEKFMSNFSKYSTNDKVETFSNAEGNTTRLPNVFYYDKFSFDNYRYENGIINLKLSSEAQISLPITLEKSRKPELLIKMLTLREKLSPSLFASPTKLLFGDDKISEKDVLKIIKWCKTNGYPFDISEEIERYSKATNSLLLLPKQDTHISFAVASFICQLNEVYCSFIMYRYLVGLIDRLPAALYTKGQNKNQKGIYEFVELNKLSKNECKELFEYKYQNIVFQNTISFSNGIHFDIKTYNLFDAAFYQLALMLSVDNKDLRVCPLCNEYFEPSNARQKYCGDKCYPQKAYKRKKMAEKKKEQLNQQGLTTLDK